MKKTFMTFVAIGFGFSVAFAQSAPVENNPSILQSEQATVAQQEENGRKEVEMETLPEEVKQSFANGQYKEWQVLAIYETKSESAEGLIYEFELAQPGNTAEATSSANNELAGIDKEQVSVRQPDLILQLDQKGFILEEKEPEEMNKIIKEEQED